jgi:heme A synthase
VGRAIWMAGHLVNTFLLLGALTLTAWWAAGGGRLRWRGQGAVAVWLLLAVVGMFVLGASGAITALGDTLVITGGISPQENALVATLVDLRIYHPMIAIAVGALVALAAIVAMNRRPGPQTQRFAWALIVLYVAQLALGALNVALKAPVWLQMLHLLVTSAIWILLVLLAAAALSAPLAEGAGSRTSEPSPAQSGSTV